MTKKEPVAKRSKKHYNGDTNKILGGKQCQRKSQKTL